ncbi:type II toxin-antitoxin system RelE/ParE family toxin [Roseateles sp. UC29_93]|uniref:type II toxin-antitoxin system RelE/ParE family toxin n=1 Tax=Roseateles sp. UC29_93 TaxID=3350177 RepID=UPI0002ECFB0E
MLNPKTIECRARALLRIDLILEEMARHNQLAAEEFGRQMVKKLRLALSFPMLYRASSRVAGIREIVLTPNYFVPYRVTPEAIEVLDLVHTRQNWPDPSASALAS